MKARKMQRHPNFHTPPCIFTRHFSPPGRRRIAARQKRARRADTSRSPAFYVKRHKIRIPRAHIFCLYRTPRSQHTCDESVCKLETTVRSRRRRPRPLGVVVIDEARFRATTRPMPRTLYRRDKSSVLITLLRDLTLRLSNVHYARLRFLDPTFGYRWDVVIINVIKRSTYSYSCNSLRL